MATIQEHTELIKQANKITNRKTIYAAGAGLIPIPIVDTTTLLGVQLTMIQSIAKLYGVPFKRHIAKSLIGSLVSSIGSVGLIKFVPGLGTIVGGAMASVAGAVSTYALGRIFTLHFDQGGTLLDFDPIASREYFQKEYEAGQLFVAQQNLLDLGETGDTSTQVGETSRKQLIAQAEQLQAALVGLQSEIKSLQAKRAEKTPEKDLADAATATGKAKQAATSKSKAKKRPNTAAIAAANLTIIEGIGPKTEAVLKAAGIPDLEALSKADIGQIRQILKEADGNFNHMDPGTWLQQAALAASGQREELMVLQDKLTGGRTKRNKKS